MNNSSPTSNLHFRERRRAPIACTNCRAVKLRCRPIDPVDNSPCERCVKRQLLCEYRPVDPGPVSNTQHEPPENFPIHDNLPVNLYPAPSAPSAPPVDQSQWFQPYVSSPTSGESAPYHTYYAPAQAPFQPNQPSYPTPQYQQTIHPSSYPTQHAYPTSPTAYQPSYQFSPQFDGQPSNQLPYYAREYPSGYDYRGQPFDHYEGQINDSKPAKE